MSGRAKSAASSSLRKNRRQTLQAAIRGALPAGVVAVLGGGAALTASGQTYYFQGDGYGPATGGSGIFTTSLPRFTTDPTGNSGYTTFGFGATPDIIFGTNGGVVQIAPDGIAVGAQSLTFRSDYVLTNASLIPAGSLTLSGGGTNAGYIDTGTNTVTIIPGIAGNAGLTKVGTGTLILNGASTFTGPLKVNAGTVAFDDNQGGLPNTNVDATIAAGASLNFGYNGNVVQETLAANGFGSINGAGNFNMGALLYQGATNGSRILFTSTNDSTFTGTITGTGNIVKVGGSTWNLGGTNTMSGILDVGGPSNIASTLNILSDTAISSNATLTLAAQTVVATNGGTVISINLNNHNVVAGNLISNTSNSGSNSVLVLGTLGGGTTGTGGSITFGGLSYNGIGVNGIFESNITGYGNLIKTGTGVEYFINNTNNFTGRVTIQQGELAASSDTKFGAVPTSFTAQQITLDGGSLGSGNAAFTLSANRGIYLTNNGGGIHTPSTFTLTYGGAIDGPGNLLKWGAAGLTLATSQNYTGGTRLLDGTITNTLASISGTNINVLGTGSVYVSGSTLSLSPASNKGNVVLAVAPGAGSQFTYGPGSILSVAQNVNTNVTVTFGNAGDAASPFVRGVNGSLTINSGTGGLATLGTAGGIQIFAANGNMPVTNGIVDPSIIGTVTSTNSTGEFLTYGAGGLAQGAYSAGTDINTAAATDVFSAASNQTIASTASVYALNVRGTTVTGGGLTVGDGAHAASIIMNGGAITTTGLNFNGDAVVYASTNNGSITAPINGTGGFTKVGAGNLTLSGASNYSGSTYVSAGTLTLAGNNVLPSATGLVLQNAATLDMTNTSQTVGSLSGSNTSTIIKLGNTGSLTVGAGTSQYFGAITGAATNGTATLIKNGPGTLTLGWTGSGPDNFGNVANSFNKLVVQNGGVVAVSSSTALGSAPSGTLTASIVADNITLNNGRLELTSGGTDAFISNLVSTNNYGANRGIVLGPGGGTIAVSQFFEVGYFGLPETASYAGTVALTGTSSIISGSGNLYINGKGTFRTYGGNTYTGKTILQSGVFQVASATNYASFESGFGAVPASPVADNITFDGGQLLDSGGVGSGDILSINRGIFVTANGGVINHTGGNFLEIDGAITGPGVLTETGISTVGLILTNSNNNFGGLNLLNNWLLLGANHVLGSGVVTLNPNSTYDYVRMDNLGAYTESNSWVLLGNSLDSFRIGGGGTGTNSTLTLTGAISGTADLIKDTGVGVSTTPSTTQGYGNLVLAGNNTYTGNTVVKSGTLVVAADNALGSTVKGTQVFSGAAIAFTNSVNYTAAESLSVAGTGVIGGGNGVIVAYPGVNRFAGSIDMMDSSTVDIAAGASLELAGGLAGGSTMTVNGDGTDSILILSGTNNIGGSLNINVATLGIGSGTALGNSSNTVNLSVSTILGTGNANVTRDLNIGSAVLDARPGAVLGLGGALTYNGDLTKGTNLGTVALSQPAGFTANGNINVLGGTLAVGFGTNGATGPLSVPGTLSVSDGALVAFLPNPTASITHSVNTLNLNTTGRLDIANHNLLTNTPSTTIRSYLIAGGAATGTWNGASGITSTSAALDPTHSRAIGYADGSDGIVAGLSAGQTLVKSTIYGDADLNGRVQIADFNILSANFRQNNGSQTWDHGDFNYNGSVTIQDYNLLSAQFGKRVTAGSPNAAASASSQALTASPAALTPGNPALGTLEFDVDGTTGHITLVANQAAISSYDLESSANNANGDFTRANWIKIATLSGTLSSANQSYELDQEAPAGSTVTLNGSYDLGNVLPAGLTPAQYLADLTDPTGLGNGPSSYGIASGATVNAPVFVTVPEPTCLALAGLVGAGLLSRKRRTK